MRNYIKLLVALTLLGSPAFATSPPWRTDAGNVLVGPTVPLVPNSAGAFVTNFTPKAFSGSLTITTGGTAQNIAAAAEVINGCTLVGNTTNTATIYVDFTGAAASATGPTSYAVAPGQAVACPGGLSTAVSIESPTTGQSLNGEEW
jgi:hypothetical protein